MPLKLIIGLSKKVGEANYGSHIASIHLELEVVGSLATEPAKLQERIRQMFTLVRTSLNDELKDCATAANESLPSACLASSETCSLARVDSLRMATAAQVRAIHSIARALDLDLEAGLFERYQVKRAADLALRQASHLIDSLKLTPVT